MIRVDNIHSLTEFRTNAKDHLERLAKTKGHEVLTVNGEAKAVVLSPEAYDELVADAQYARNLRAIRRGMEAVKNGDTIPAEEVFAEVRGILGLKRDE
jgi:PHD/YefM family antitoxin component YafN of YafNO toxin-antitoxin module